MPLHANTQVYVPHLDKWGTITINRGSKSQVKFTEQKDVSLYDRMYTEVDTYENIDNDKLCAYYPDGSWVRHGRYSGRVLSSRYDKDAQQFMYKIHVGADQFETHWSDYGPSDQEYTVNGCDLD